MVTAGRDYNCYLKKNDNVWTKTFYNEFTWYTMKVYDNKTILWDYVKENSCI